MTRIIKIILFLSPFISTICKGQLYGTVGLSIPDKNLSNVAGDGFTAGADYRHRLSGRFHLTGSACFTFFKSKHYPEFSPVGVPFSSDYRVNMLPVLLGISFRPFNGKFTKKIFVSGKAGGQWIFYTEDDIGTQESIYYTSKELDFGYGYQVGLDLGVCQFVMADTFASSKSNTLIQNVSYFTFMLNVKITDDFWHSKK